MENALETAGTDVIKMEWSRIEELCTMIGTIHQLSRSCPLLTVCIMCHGSAGVLHGAHGHCVSVNNILHQIDQLLKRGTPLVRVPMQSNFCKHYLIHSL